MGNSSSQCHFSRDKARVHNNMMDFHPLHHQLHQFNHSSSQCHFSRDKARVHNNMMDFHPLHHQQHQFNKGRDKGREPSSTMMDSQHHHSLDLVSSSKSHKAHLRHRVG